MQLYFARHGESEANVQLIYWNQPEKYGLTGKGREQAKALADHLAGIKFVALYCSPVLRAAQTAEIVGQRIGLTPQVTDGLRERDVGILEGQEYSQETRALNRRVIAQWTQHGNPDARIEGGESYNDIRARFMPFVSRLEEMYCGTDANLLLITHGGLLSFMLPLLISNVDRAFMLDRPAGYATPVVAELRDGEWVCVRWGQDVLS